MKIKLGHQIQFKADHKIEIAKGGSALVKSGDIARVVRKIDEETAEIIYLTGEAKGLSNKIQLEVDTDLDTDSILKKIMDQIND